MIRQANFTFGLDFLLNCSKFRFIVFRVFGIFFLFLLLGDCYWDDNFLNFDLSDHKVTVFVANALLDRAVILFGLYWCLFLFRC